MNKVFALILMVGMVACNSVQLSPADYISYIQNPDNGYVQLVDNKATKLECMYKPLDYEALNRIRKTDVTTKELEEIKNELGDNYFYEMKIYYADKPTDEKQMYINYYLEKDLRLVTGNDTLKPNSFLVEPSNGVAPYQKVLFSFPATKYKGNLTVLVDSTTKNALIKTQLNYSLDIINKAKIKTN